MKYILILAIILVQGCSKKEEGSQTSLPRVEAVKLKRQTLRDQIEALGSLKSNDSVQITSKVTDTISAIHFTDGMRVQKDDILVEMTSTQEKALMSEALATLREARKQLNRVKNLMDSGAISKSLFDQRQREYDTAKARLDAVKSQLGDRTISAPFSGVVGLRNISTGMLIRPGDLITTLNDDSVMKLDFDIPSLYLSQIEQGLEISATTDVYKEKVFSGKISGISNQVNPLTRSVTVRAIIENPDNLLKQGLLMKVHIFSNQRETLVIPEEAVLSQANKVFIIKANKKNNAFEAQKVEVKLGAKYPGKVEITEGVSEGDIVVIRGAFKLNSGDAIEIDWVSDSSPEKETEKYSGKSPEKSPEKLLENPEEGQ